MIDIAASAPAAVLIALCTAGTLLALPALIVAAPRRSLRGVAASAAAVIALTGCAAYASSLLAAQLL